MGISTILIALGLLIFFSHVLNALFQKIRISNVLVLILTGLIVGPIMKWITPQFLGEFGRVFTTITLVVILFESGTSLNLESLRKTIFGASLLTILNFLIALVIGYASGRYLLHLNSLYSLFLGAALGGTSSAVVIPMIKQLKAGEKAATSLYIESALSDVFCLVIALAVLEGIDTGELSVNGILQKMGISFVFAILLGLSAGFVWTFILKRFLSGIENTMFTSFALAFILYGMAEKMGLNGGICILSYGIMVGNIGCSGIMKKLVGTFDDAGLNLHERQFYSEIVFIFQTYFFVYIGISIQLNNLWHILIGLIFAVAVLLLRPLTSWTLGRKEINLRDKKLIGAMGPRGLVAAVLASLPLQYALTAQAAAGTDTALIEKADQMIISGQAIQNVAYAVVLISIILCSLRVWTIDRKKIKPEVEFEIIKTEEEELTSND